MYDLTIHEAHERLKRKEISSCELTRAVLDRIDEVEDKVNAFITVAKESAMEQAEAADRAIAEGRITPLTGIPVSVKDLMCTKGMRTTCASRILENFVPPYDATVVEKLKDMDAVIVGKVNMDEFAMGSTTENSGIKITCNPWDLTRIPGGSSGGSAASVSAKMCLGSLGSDTGGSIRQPASHCGVVGMKPTYGRVSRYGLVAFASSLDQIGPLARDVRDCAIMMNAVSGYDPKDSTSVPKDVPDYTASLQKGIQGLTVGLPKEYFEADGLDEDVAAAVKNAVKTIEEMGGKCREITLPHTDLVVAAYYVIAPCEASSNLARYDGVKYGVRAEGATDLMDMYKKSRSRGFGPEVQRRILIGTYSLSAGYYDAYYGKASQVRTMIMEDYSKAFETCDVILAPVAPAPAGKIGENADDPLTMYLSDIFTLSANLAGIPGISVPCGLSREGLPVGLQILGKHFDEETILKVAYNFQEATDFHKKSPAL